MNPVLNQSKPFELHIYFTDGRRLAFIDKNIPCATLEDAVAHWKSNYGTRRYAAIFSLEENRTVRLLRPKRRKTKKSRTPRQKKS